VYLIDTNVISEARKQSKANPGVIEFFKRACAQDERSTCVMTVGELARGVELIRHRGNEPQAELLDSWLADFIEYFADDMLAFDAEAVQV